MVGLHALGSKVKTGLAIALSLGIILAPAVSAAESPLESITISPVDRRLSINAGEQVQDTITVLNDGQTAYDFVVYGAPYNVKNTQYTPDFTSQEPNADAYKWVRFPQAKWRIESRQTIKVPYSVAVPSDAAPGGHYGAIFAEVQPAGGDSGGSVMRKKRVGMILYVTVNGVVRMGGQTQSIAIDWLQNQSPLRVSATVGNSGNTDFLAKQTLTVADVFGRTIYQSSKEASVLPDRPREIPMEWADVPWLGFYKAKVTSTVLDKTTAKSSYVLVAPVWFLVLVVFVCTAGVVYAIRGRKTRR